MDSLLGFTFIAALVSLAEAWDGKRWSHYVAQEWWAGYVNLMGLGVPLCLLWHYAF